ncbi:hypothetical protein GCM10007291_34580 [Gemmobacter nanjingensis]|uniref:Uncharacterized protein n=1 Tax=Gemmobacter nanjingensis TaxID=488454 RepID=A0ABQ3FMV2_9RHOB|nr:hypothetical protein GCM10007291_34580 [Gemmobacter nanjingensis]
MIQIDRGKGKALTCGKALPHGGQKAGRMRYVHGNRCVIYGELHGIYSIIGCRWVSRNGATFTPCRSNRPGCVKNTLFPANCMAPHAGQLPETGLLA